jgi:hypothetical protein
MAYVITHEVSGYEETVANPKPPSTLFPKPTRECTAEKAITILE